MVTLNPDPASTWGADATYNAAWYSAYGAAGAYSAPVADVFDASVTPGQIAYADSQTQVPTPFGSAPTNNPGVIVVVPPTTQDVWLDYGAAIALTTAQATNAGFVMTAIYDVTNAGAAFIIDLCATHVNVGQPVAALLDVHYKQILIGPVTSTRIFSMSGLTNVDSGSVYPAAQFINYPGYERAFMGAFTR